MTIQEIHSRAVELRNQLLTEGYRKEDCVIGYYDGTVKLASDNGACNLWIDSNTGRVCHEFMGVASMTIVTLYIMLRKDVFIW